MKYFEVQNAPDYQIKSVCGEWYVLKADRESGRLLYFAGYDGRRPLWSCYFNFLFALSFQRAIEICDDVRGRGV